MAVTVSAILFISMFTIQREVNAQLFPILNCSEFLSTLSTDPYLTNYANLLHSCFNAHPYDTSLPPVPIPSSPAFYPLTITYDFEVVNLLSFDNGNLRVFYQLF